MSKVIADLSMSLDGFIAEPNVSVEVPMGEGGERLHEWLSEGGVDAEIARELSETAGATVVGRRMFDVGVGEWEDTPYPVPCFVLTHEQREELTMKSGTFTFVTDGIESALEQAKEAPGEKDVIVMGGANIVQQFLRAGLVDEMSLHLVPVLLGDGVRLFDGIGNELIELESTRVIDSPEVTHISYRIVKED
jgi:dihydrofolate reductase